jgi:putative aldouronate transport system permease protein
MLSLLIIAGAVTFTLHFRPLYYLDISLLRIEALSGLDKAVIIRNYDALIDYNNLFNHQPLAFPDFVMSEAGRIHFEEVKVVFDLFGYLTLFLLPLVLIGIWIANRTKSRAYLKIAGILGILIPVTLAILFNEIYSKKLAKTCQTMMFLPHFLSWVVVSYFVYAFLATDNGLINRAFHFVEASTGQNHNWYQDTNFWMYFLFFLNVWKGMGYSMVVYMASISGIDGELYEAALIDGASKSQQVKYITLPLLRPTISIMFIMAVGNIFRSDFGLFYQATRNSGALTSVTQTIDVYVYKALLEQSNVNLSSAAAFLQSTVGCITIVAANLIVKKIDPEAGLF